MFGRHTVHVEEAHLLGLQIGNGGALRERIEVVVAQTLAVAALGAGLLQGRPLLLVAIIIGRPCAAVHLGGGACHQQRLRIVIGRAAGIGQRDPALDVDLAVGLVEQRHIVRMPAETRGEVAQGGRARSRMAADHGHRQGGARAQILRHLVEYDPDRQAVVAQHFDVLTDLQHHAAVGGEHLRLLARFRAGGRIDAHDGDLLADRLFHELGGSQQIEIEVLFDDADVGSPSATPSPGGSARKRPGIRGAAGRL